MTTSAAVRPSVRCDHRQLASWAGELRRELASDHPSRLRLLSIEARHLRAARKASCR